MSKCVVINQPFANSSHGTGKQLQYFMRISGLRSRHLCWDRTGPKGDEPAGYINLFYDWSSSVGKWYLPVARSIQYRLIKKVPSRWWEGGSLTTLSKLRIRMRLRHYGCAYVVVSSEESARVARACLAELNVPYILNWMDLETSEEITENSHPEIVALCRGASKVFAITPSLATMIAPYTRRSPQLLGIGRPPAETAAAAATDSTLRCVMIGSLHYPSLESLWPLIIKQVRAKGTHVKIFYLGSKTMFELAPKELNLEYLGFVTDEKKRDAVLSTMHIAFLPGPDGDPADEHLARYSFPSRVADYLYLGLPVVGTVHEDSSTAEVLKPLLGSAVWLSKETKQLSQVITQLASNPDQWTVASSKARAFAQEHFDAAKVVGHLVEALEGAAKSR